MPELVFFRRGEEVLRFALERSRVVLGRGDGNDVVIPDPAVSRQQLAISLVDGRARLEDLSGKGTTVSGLPTSESMLEDGSDIALGQWRAVFRQRISSDAAETTESPDGRTILQKADAAAFKWQPAQVRVRFAGNEVIHKLIGEGFTVGSDATNDVVVPDPFVSGRHLKVTRRDGGFHVADQGSRNGTFLGGVRVYEAEVPIGSTLRLGGAELTVEPVMKATREPPVGGIIGNDASVRQLLDLIEKVAPSNAAVAIFGESGTGKELVARAVHERSARANKPFIPVNCAAISKELIESELFGHEKGAFTGAATTRLGAFEEAHGGTLFLDEIGELPLELQAKLLRALESGEIKRVGASRPIHVDVRLVAATNRDLLSDARSGRFREDLYYRLCVVPLHLSPLRNRRGDIVSLAEHFVRQFAPRGQVCRFTGRALERLQTHRWPGNIRELRNVVHRALLLRRGPTIDAEDLSFDQHLDEESGVALSDAPSGTLEQMLERLERQIVENALRRYNNNKERVAKELGVARSTLFKRLKHWGLTRSDEPE